MTPTYNCLHPLNTSKYSEFIFNACRTDWLSNGVTLVGRSGDEHAIVQFPEPARGRGVFFSG
jgi:hypothetical protein